MGNTKKWTCKLENVPAVELYANDGSVTVTVTIPREVARELGLIGLEGRH